VGRLAADFVVDAFAFKEAFAFVATALGLTAVALGLTAVLALGLTVVVAFGLTAVVALGLTAVFALGLTAVVAFGFTAVTGLVARVFTVVALAVEERAVVALGRLFAVEDDDAFLLVVVLALR